MNDVQFRGILAAVVTPFSSDGSTVDPEGVRRQTEHIISGGIQGLVPGGSTGEFTTLSTAERKQVTELYLEAAADRVPVVAGTGALSTSETVDLSRHASRAGAAAVMVVPPFYDTPSWDELLAHFGAISDAIDVPIMYYNIPSATGLTLTPDRFAELASKTRVTCYKDTGGDASAFATVRSHHEDVITALNGWDTLTFQALALGTEAAVWGTANVIPALCSELFQAVAVDRDLQRGQQLWRRIQPVCEFLESHNYAAGIKTGLSLVGQDAGPTRLPVLSLPPKARADFADILTSAGVALMS